MAKPSGSDHAIAVNRRSSAQLSILDMRRSSALRGPRGGRLCIAAISSPSTDNAVSTVFIVGVLRPCSSRMIHCLVVPARSASSCWVNDAACRVWRTSSPTSRADATCWPSVTAPTCSCLCGRDATDKACGCS